MAATRLDLQAPVRLSPFATACTVYSVSTSQTKTDTDKRSHSPTTNILHMKLWLLIVCRGDGRSTRGESDEMRMLARPWQKATGAMQR